MADNKNTTHFSGPLAIGSGQFETVTAAKTLSAKDNGKTFVIATTGYTHTLPAPFAGAAFRWVMSTALSTDFVITGGNSLMHGAVDINSARVNWTGDSVITIQDDKETIGDWYELWSDGTNWYVDGFGEVAAAAAAS